MSFSRRKDSKNRVLQLGEYERKNGTYEYRWVDKMGISHSIYASKLDELRKKKREIQRDMLDEVRIDSKRLTINDVYSKWKQLKKGLKDNTFRNYQYSYEKFVSPNFGKIKLSVLKRSDVRAFYIELIEKHHMKVASVECIHTVLHQVLEFAVNDDILRYNPSDNALKELKRSHIGESEKRSALTQEEQRLFETYLLNNRKHNRWYPIFTVMLWTGMRVGEIAGLRWCDIDLEKGTISVNHTLVYYSKGKRNGGCLFKINTTKTKAGKRIIPMLPIVKEAFIKELEYQRELEQVCNSEIDGYTDFIFLNRFGCVFNYGTLNKAQQRIIRDCNCEVLRSNKGKHGILLPQFSNHTLRHTFSTRMSEAGINIKAMQDILGHADAQTTLNIYTDATSELKQQALDRFEQYIAEHRLTPPS